MHKNTNVLLKHNFSLQYYHPGLLHLTIQFQYSELSSETDIHFLFFERIFEYNKRKGLLIMGTLQYVHIYGILVLEFKSNDHQIIGW